VSERTTTHRILLADADAFFVAVARLVDPDGAGREPFLIVGGTSDGRGVVTSASYEAREFGVRSAMPTAQALRLCPNAVVVPVPRSACVEKSRQILSVLRRFTPAVEPASIDEFYLDLTGTERLYTGESLAETAGRIRSRVFKETGLTVSIGGGTSKLIAKLAARVAKPRRDPMNNGVHVVEPGAEAAFLATLDLAAIPMIGPKFQERLARHGLRRVTDVLPIELTTLQHMFGKREGSWLYHRVRGEDVSAVARQYNRKSIGHEETFPRDLSSDEDLDRELLRLVVQLTGDLRGKLLQARTVTVKLRDSDFTTRTASLTLPHPVSTERVILETSRELLGKLRSARRTSARLIGVSLSHLHLHDDEAAVQLGLFDGVSALQGRGAEPGGVETERDQALARVVDAISARFGRRGIVRGAQMSKPNPPPSIIDR
jgi:DNA polymerase IV